MGEVIVYAEPEAKNEAAQFVTSLGGRPESRSLYSEIKSSLEKTKGLMIYLKGDEPLGTVRNRLRQFSRQHAPKTVVFTVHANQEKAAESGGWSENCNHVASSSALARNKSSTF